MVDLTPAQSAVLDRCIRECTALHEELTAANLNDKMTNAELALFDGGIEIDASSESLKNFEPLHANGTGQPHDDTVRSTPGPISTPVRSVPASDQAAESAVLSAPPPTISVAECAMAVQEAQIAYRLATDRQRDCRGRVAQALDGWQRSMRMTCTPEQLRREYLASEQEQRRLRVEGRDGPRNAQRRLGSAVDSFAYHTRHSGRGAGGGRAFGRGAYPASMRGRIIPKG